MIVDSKKVQDSGLLKDTIDLDVPGEAGDMTTVLLRRVQQSYARFQVPGSPMRQIKVRQIPLSPLRYCRHRTSPTL